MKLWKTVDFLLSSAYLWFAKFITTDLRWTEFACSLVFLSVSLIILMLSLDFILFSLLKILSDNYILFFSVTNLTLAFYILNDGFKRCYEIYGWIRGALLLCKYLPSIFGSSPIEYKLINYLRCFLSIAVLKNNQFYLTK